MKSLLVMCLVLTFANSAYSDTAKNNFLVSDDWHYQASTSKGKVYLKGIVKDGNTYDFWMKSQNDKLECDKNSFGLSPTDKFICDQSKKTEQEISISHYVLSCKTRKMKSTNTVSYNYSGDIIDSSSKAGNWQAIFPDSIGEDILKTLCQ